jgi:hypothetical protein
MNRHRPTSKPRVTLLSIIIGLFLIPVNAYWVLESEAVWGVVHATVLSLFFNVIFILFALSVLNLALRKWLPSLALNTGELLTIYVILCIATSLYGHDMIQTLVPLMNYGYWFATPENGWEDLFWGYLPGWLMMSDNKVATGYHEGDANPYDSTIIKAWINPILFWTGFIMILYFTMICIVTLIRRRWIEAEKLSYPIIQLPLEMTVNSVRFFKSRLMWIGFGISAVLDTVHGLHRFFPFVPDFVTKYNLAPFFAQKPWNAISWLPICFYPFVIGLAYFMPLDLSFSTWFFYLFWKIQLVVRSALGLGRLSGAYMGDQSAGAWIGIGALSVWLSRRSIFRIIRSVFGSRAIDDSREPLPYKVALVGVIAGIGLLCLFSWRAGMSLWVSISFFCLYFIIVLAATRMRAELGPPTHDLYYAGPGRIMTAVVGSKRLGPSNLVGFTIYFWKNRDYRCHAMPHQLEGFKLAERTGFGSRKLVLAIMLATLVGTIATFWAMLHLSYTSYGPTSLYQAREAFVRLQNWLEYPSGPDNAVLRQMGFGLGLTVFLMVMHRRFVGFPFHPVGYAVAGSWTMSWMWFSVMLSWLIKYILLRSGGLRIYRKGVPFFLGLMLGQFVVGSLWSILGVIINKPVYGFFV